MVSIEYGDKHAPAVLLLHGGGLSWWNFREAAEILKSKYHVILPILNGHAGSDMNFTSIEENASEILRYIDDVHGGRVALIGGVSLGAQILTEMLARRRDVCRYAVIESARIIPMRFSQFLIKPAMDMSYGLIRREWFARLQFKSLRLKQELFGDYYRDTCRLTKENMTAFLQANARYRPGTNLSESRAKAVVLAGQKEPAVMIRSAQRLNQMLPGSRLEILPRLHHGEFSMNHAAEYAGKIIDIIENSSGTLD